MISVNHKVVLIVLYAVFLVAGVMTVVARAELKLGILPRLRTLEMVTMFTPLADYLSRETGEKVTLVIPKDFDAFKRMVSSGQVDMGFSNPLVYVQLMKDDPSITPLAVASEKAGTRFRGLFIVRKDSGINSMQDLNGKKLIILDKSVFQVLTARLDIPRDIIMLPTKHNNVAMAVFNGVADAGGIPESDLDRMKTVVDMSQIKIIGYTDYCPNWPLFGTRKMNKTTADKVKSALLKLKPKSTKALKVTSAAGINGFAPVDDQEYDEFRKAARAAGTL